MEFNMSQEKKKQQSIPVQLGKRYQINITALSEDGVGIGRVDGFTVFCDGTLPKETVKIQIFKVTKSYAIGNLISVVTSSPLRIVPTCIVNDKCGGCTFGHFNYEGQLAVKEQHVVDCINRIGGISNFTLRPIIGMESPYNYRNKAQYPFGKNYSCGFYQKRSHELIDIQDCMLEHPSAKDIRNFVVSYIKHNDFSIYDEASGTGLVRSMLLRSSSLTGNSMLVLVVNNKDEQMNKFIRIINDDFIKQISEKLPNVVSIYVNINNENTNVVLGKKFIHIFGEEALRDSIGEAQFDISPMSFFQTNSVQTKKLYDTVLEFANINATDNVLDLYCGIGTIGIYLASVASVKPASITGIECIPEAIEDAKHNAEINGIANAKFYAGDASIMDKCLGDNHYDIIILDPPRKGCDEKLLESVVSQNPTKIIYVSCNPATLARDLKYLNSKDYSLDIVQPIDMFPWTSHVECVVLITKK